jgi:hypothetical protein
MRKRLATLLALGILAGGLVSVVTSIATPQPAAACVGDDCGRAGIELHLSDGPYYFGTPIGMQVVAEDTSHSCDVAGIGCASPSGTIEIYEDGVGPPILTAPLRDGCGPDDDEGNCKWSHTEWQAVCCIRAGSPQLLYKYIPSGADPFEPTERVAQIGVRQAPTRTVFTASPSSSVYGEPVTLTARVTSTRSIHAAAHPVTSYVNFKYWDQGAWRLIAGAFVENGVATLVTNEIPQGFWSLRAEYETDGDYAASIDELSYWVTRGEVTNTLTQSAATTVFGEPFSVTSTVAPVAPSQDAPSGDVTFKAGAATVGTATLNGASPGVATLSSNLGVGTHSIVAEFPGDTGYNPKTSDAIIHAVNKANTVTTLVASPNPSNPGQEVTLSATVGVVAPGAGPPTGSVQFVDGTTPLGSPVPLTGTAATLKVKGLGGGSHSVSARYLGDGNFNSSTSAPQTHTGRCDRVVTSVSGNYSVPATGTTCITNGNVSGSVMVPAGATLSITNSTIGGQLMSTSGGGTLLVCGSSIAGVTINGNAGPVIVGDAGCAGNSIGSNVTLNSNRGGVTFGGNTVGGSLQCSGNSPVATNGGRPNTVRGSRTGECAAAGF